MVALREGLQKAGLPADFWHEQLAANGVRFVRDAQLCHGAAGVGHVFHELFRATGDAVFRDRARTWFAHALTLRGEDGAFLSWRTQPPPDRWEFDAGYLEGNAGIGLALADALGLARLPWDRPLALSLRLP